MTTYISVIPAYGRDYRSRREVEDAWNAGKDFFITSIEHQGRYLSIRDVRSDVMVCVRYGNGRKTHMVVGGAQCDADTSADDPADVSPDDCPQALRDVPGGLS